MDEVIPTHNAVILGLDPRIYRPSQAVATVPTHLQTQADPRDKPEDDGERMRRR